MSKIPPNRRKGTASSLRKIADKLDLPMGKGRPVKPATAGPVPDYAASTLANRDTNHDR